MKAVGLERMTALCDHHGSIYERQLGERMGWEL